MRCPFKFTLYGFEGGQDCIGIECGMFKRCNADDEITAVEFNALDEHAQALERENAELKAKLDQMTVERDILQDCVDDLNADASELQRQVDEFTAERDGWKAKAKQAERAMNAAAGKWAKADEESRELRKMLVLDDGTVEDYTERADPLTALAHQKQLAEEWRDRCHNAEKWCDKLEAERDELQAKVDELTAELTAARNAHAQAEHEAVILREKLGRALDYAHEITSVGGDVS